MPSEATNRMALLMGVKWVEKPVWSKKDMTETQPDLVEVAARSLAEADGITICSDAQYRHSSYGHRVQAVIAAIEPIIAEKAREDERREIASKAIHLADGHDHCQRASIGNRSHADHALALRKFADALTGQHREG